MIHRKLVFFVWEGLLEGGFLMDSRKWILIVTLKWI
jgi:hypothetical protein